MYMGDDETDENKSSNNNNSISMSGKHNYQKHEYSQQINNKNKENSLAQDNIQKVKSF